jgi:hypothetical protein
MLDTRTFWAIFGGAQACGQRIPGHAHPHWYLDCVYCDCMNAIHTAGMALLQVPHA